MRPQEHTSHCKHNGASGTLASLLDGFGGSQRVKLRGKNVSASAGKALVQREAGTSLEADVPGSVALCAFDLSARKLVREANLRLVVRPDQFYFVATAFRKLARQSFHNRELVKSAGL